MIQTFLVVGIFLVSTQSILNAVEPKVEFRGSLNSELGVTRSGNVYAPEIRRVKSLWFMWYGGQGLDGHDRIHLATSVDLKAWTKKGVVLVETGVNHQNDPSCVNVGGVWWMFYTRAAQGINDEIAAATSADGINWTRRGVVFRPSSGSGWDSLVVSRPSVLYESGIYKLWYDARGLKPGAVRPTTTTPEDLLAVAGPRAIGYAESNDGLTWRRYGQTSVFGEGAGAIHVKHLPDGYVMLYESQQGTKWASSSNGRAWTVRGLLAPVSGSAIDSGGHVTPWLYAPENTSQWAIYFGCNSGDWSKNLMASIPITRFQAAP